MPGLSAIELLREIRSDPLLRTTHVIMYSGEENIEHRRESRELGALAWIPKATG